MSGVDSALTPRQAKANVAHARQDRMRMTFHGLPSTTYRDTEKANNKKKKVLALCMYTSCVNQVD